MPDRSHRFSLPLWLAAFGVFGLLYGVWQVLLADLSRALDLSPGPLGAALSVGIVASLPAMVAGGGGRPIAGGNGQSSPLGRAWRSPGSALPWWPVSVS